MRSREMSENSPSQNPPIDVPSLFDRCMNDSAFVKEILDLFREQAVANLSALAQALEAGDAEQVWKLAHTLKGSAANVSADHLSETFAEIEQVAHKEAFDRAKAMLVEVRNEFDRVVAFFPELLRQVESNG
jgi:HPt (histidine-containing phosphotransfer) domain-containing protein